ncbi:DNA alkylation repair protein [Latilactobacillus fuchuensis]|uniref:DNA alkylation repair protein n=1 Tax=Latilactobacillus fuchuensis TaxID=164393 RepID=UPI0039B10C07
MAELLKDIYHRDFLTAFAAKVQQVLPTFNAVDFVETTLARPWDELALKQRTRKIATILGHYLPQSYQAAIKVLMTIAPECYGFPYLFFSDFVVVYGDVQDDWDLSMQALECFTQQSSAEFAIRPFILADPTRAMAQLNRWAQSDHQHVRRLATEGCRPRLPWGQSLPIFKADPTPVLALLEQLRNDPALYVRKSVANNLNDIAKDHPNLVIATAKRWQGQSVETDWIIRHGCRTLLRKSFDTVKGLFSYAVDQPKRPLVQFASLMVRPTTVAIGAKTLLQYNVQLRAEDALFVRIEYAVDYVKANGQTSRKLFKLLDKSVNGAMPLVAQRQLNFKDLTTRKHYPGCHQVTLIVNGQSVAQTALAVTD